MLQQQATKWKSYAAYLIVAIAMTLGVHEGHSSINGMFPYICDEIVTDDLHSVKAICSARQTLIS